MTSKARQDTKWGYFFISPWILGLLLFTLIPIVFSLYLSFTEWDIVTGLQTIKFVGLENYRELFHDRKFAISLGVTFKFSLISIPLYQILALIIALILNRRMPLMRTFRVIYFLPSIIPVIASSMIWMQILGEKGLLNQGLKMIE